MTRYAGIDREAAISLLSSFIRIPSINPAFRTENDEPSHFGEEAVAEVLCEWLEGADIDCNIEAVEPGRPNLVARVKGRSGTKRMLWEGHLDTVQVAGMADPFTPRMEGDKIFGRGAVDDGASVIAFMLAMRALKASPPEADVDFLAAMDEEYSYRGILHHLARKEHYDLGVAGEPTSLRVIRACKGTVRWWVNIEGRNAHTGKPQEGINGITIARRVLELYDDEMARRTVAHPLLGPATLTCTAIEAGVGPNTVPAACRLRFDYRYLPTELGTEVHAAFKSAAEAAVAEFPGARITVEAPFVDSSAMDIPEASEIVARMSKICGAYGIDPMPIGVPYGSDATKMVNIAAIPTIIFGPGSIDQAHAIDEYAEIEPILKAAKMLVDLAHELDTPL
ncbi:M20/M25/M40 family metallo-hydrolase [Falsochrobactrum sp. TDYN1]|uniref:M20/M25/M40 family metallo-hydrolase n=1 Tax=Falsochrobactrum tianjinense TaxID=2706015 RepID=A0A949PNY9_9HYPH|nr:M20/M25/M40 family metallo-hydrolase [Falsochrobactrum sp. TDYN1]MBV2143544.1 M20/M25/M40 family metallo-hydrolase [Falsochrobactrum sp. TDYN1]